MTEMNFDQARHNMIEQQIRTWNMLDMSVIETLESFPREKYVPSDCQKLAYADIGIPLTHGQEMMHPKLEAHFLQALDIKPTDNILEIGTGSGCLTALLATRGAHVDSVDIFPEFQKAALKKLSAENVNNVTMIQGDGSAGWGEPDQYDAIAITGSLEELPEQYIKALKVDGRLFAVVGTGQTMEAISIHRSHGNNWEKTSLFETELPPLVNAPKPETFEF